MVELDVNENEHLLASQDATSLILFPPFLFVLVTFLPIMVPFLMLRLVSFPVAATGSRTVAGATSFI